MLPHEGILLSLPPNPPHSAPVRFSSNKCPLAHSHLPLGDLEVTADLLGPFIVATKTGNQRLTQQLEYPHGPPQGFLMLRAADQLAVVVRVIGVQRLGADRQIPKPQGLQVLLANMLRGLCREKMVSSKFPWHINGRRKIRHR